MTDDEVKALESMAQAATPGPWRRMGGPERPCPVVVSDGDGGYQIHSMLWVKRNEPDVYGRMRKTYIRDADFIAAANPASVLALLERVRRAEAPVPVATREDPIRLTMAAGGLVTCASVVRPDGSPQSMRFDPPVSVEVADRMMAALSLGPPPAITAAVAELNGALDADPDAMAALFAFRVPCNDALAGHPSVRVRGGDGGNSVGVLGLINGILGAMPDGPRKGWGWVSMLSDESGPCLFEVTRNDVAPSGE